MYRTFGIFSITLVLSILFLSIPQKGFSEPPAAHEGPFLHESEVTWKVNNFAVARWKTLVGGIEGGQIDDPDVQFGLWELAPYGIYHGHKHYAPEIYYILSGEADWRVGDTTEKIQAGSTIYTKPGTVHSMTNLTDQPVTAIWLWWAPNGNRKVFSGEYTFT